MRGFLKAAAIVQGILLGAGLGFLINLALTEIEDFSLALLVVIAALFIGGFIIVALFIFLWAKANGDWDYKGEVVLPQEEPEQEREQE